MPVQRKGMRALEIWCDRVTRDYGNVKVVDLSTSFRDGLAFIGIIHHFRPDLIGNPVQYEAKNVLENNSLAFRVAEEKLGIPALLEAQDMVESEFPDKLSVVTYLAQFYHLFKNDESNISISSLESGSSSSEATPTGTPTNNKKILFDQQALIEKYGEDMFKSSEKTANNLIANVCKDFELKAKISAAEKRSS